jgi:nitrogen-specific signal transduction histidine kinase
LNVIERRQLVDQLTSLEITQKRLEAIQEVVLNITQQIREPLQELRGSLESLSEHHRNDSLAPYLNIIKVKLDEIESKIARLKALRSDRTVAYVKDIRMIDLSQ